MFYPRYDHRLLVCDHPACYRSVSGVGFQMLLTLARRAKWLIVKDGDHFWHFCSPACKEQAKALRAKNPSVLRTARSAKYGAISRQELAEKERMAV